MALLSLQEISINFSGKSLLDKADLHIEEGERVCLVGRNGAGKSTLLSILAGVQEPDSGRVIRGQGVIFGYMPQDIPPEWTGAVFDVVAGGLGAPGKEMRAAHMLANGQQATLPPELRQKAEALLNSGNGWDSHGDILSIIRHLGLDPEAQFNALSGGGKRRVALARALVESTDLLLDEPTNHLDIETVLWLEEFLQRRARTLVFISHDRAFASRLATRIVEVDRGRLHSYECPYDLFLERREARLEAEERQAAVFDRKLAQEEAWIRQGIKARRTRNMGRVRALQALRAERAARRERQGAAQIHIQSAERSGKLVFEAENVTFAYPGQEPVIKNCTTSIMRGDRVGIIGKNGTGKSTLIHILLGDLLPQTGTVRHGTRLEISYFDQLRETLDPNASVMDSVAEGNDVVTVGGRTRHVAGYLKDFLFDSDKLRVPVGALSGGERNRLLLAKLFTRPSNTLVLDEPTNDLDVETLELLEELLSEYAGTVLVVSHDRAFLDNLATSTLVLEGDGFVREYVGGYTDWIRQRETPKTDKPKKDTKPEAKTRSGPRKLSFNEQRELKLLREELDQLPEKIDQLEKEQAAVEQKLSDPDLFKTDQALFHKATQRMTELEEEQNSALERWEFLEKRIAELESFE